MTNSSESKIFDQGVRKILSVSREELKRREAAWKDQRKQAKEKRAKILPASRVSNDKD